MKVNFNFDRETRSILLTPEDSLEELLCREIAERCEKGSQLKVKAINQEVSNQLVVELKVNGH